MDRCLLIFTIISPSFKEEKSKVGAIYAGSMYLGLILKWSQTPLSGKPLFFLGSDVMKKETSFPLFLHFAVVKVRALRSSSFLGTYSQTCSQRDLALGLHWVIFNKHYSRGPVAPAIISALKILALTHFNSLKYLQMTLLHSRSR